MIGCSQPHRQFELLGHVLKQERGAFRIKISAFYTLRPLLTVIASQVNPFDMPNNTRNSVFMLSILG